MYVVGLQPNFLAGNVAVGRDPEVGLKVLLDEAAPVGVGNGPRGCNFFGRKSRNDKTLHYNYAFKTRSTVICIYNVYIHRLQVMHQFVGFLELSLAIILVF